MSIVALARTVVCAGWIVTSTIAVVAQAAAAQGKCMDHRTLLDGIRDARLRLTSGIYRAKGHRVLRTNEQGVMEGDVACFCAFDYLNKEIRSDREDPIIFVDPRIQKESVLQIGYKLIQLPEKTYYLDLGGGLKTTNILTVAAADFRSPNYGLSFDVRTFGLVDWSSIDEPTPFEKTIDVFEKFAVLGVREELDGRCVLVIQPHESVKIELWVNAANGYTVERSEMRILDKITKEWGDIIAFADLTWTERDGVWIPTSINLERHFNGREAYYAALDWESVNQTPAESLFRPDGLGLDPDSIIVDQRLGDKPVVIGKIKDNGRPPAPPERIEPSRSTTDRVYWILVGNAVALGLLGACYLWHRLHRG